MHARELKEISERAADASRNGDAMTALQHWRRSLELLPVQSRQHQLIRQKIDDLTREVGPSKANAPPAPATAKSTGAGKVWSSLGIVGTLGLLLWKFKFILGFLLTKGKLLILGLTKASTLFSMILSLGVYWAAWGWPFALGLVLSIYVHEMGHVAALRRLGMHATAPMFIPGLGALIRLKQHPMNPKEDAYIGLAGPIWGLAAAVLAYGLFWATGAPILAAIAQVGAWINLFNLLPIWQLDGGRAFHALSRRQQWLAVAAIGGMLLVTSEGLLILLLLIAVVQAIAAPRDRTTDPVALAKYVALVVILSLMSKIPVPVPVM